MVDGTTPVFTNLDKLPWSIPTVSDLENLSGDSRKTGLVFKGVKFRLYDMCTDEGICRYEKDKAELIDMIRLHKATVCREASLILMVEGSQHLHIVIEWVEHDWDIYEAGGDGTPVKSNGRDTDDSGSEDNDRYEENLDALESVSGFSGDSVNPFIGSDNRST